MIPKFVATLLTAVLLAGVLMAASKPVSDNAISDEVRIKLTSDPVVKGGDLKADVKEGVVTLSGTVTDQQQKDKAKKLAGKVKGVKQVINNITVSKSGR
jgi:hyperosmotically inducible periplasmic protein